jgi:hypothetical protein
MDFLSLVWLCESSFEVEVEGKVIQGAQGFS